MSELDLERGSIHADEAHSSLLFHHSISSPVDQHAEWPLNSAKPFNVPSSSSLVSIRRTALWLLVLISSIGLVAHGIYPSLLPRASLTQDALRSPTTPSQTAFVLWPPPRQNLTAASNRYVAFRTNPIPIPSQSASLIAQGQPLSFTGLELLFDPTDFNWPPKSLHTHFPSPSKFDIVHTWVNGSDPLHRLALHAAEARVLADKRLLGVTDAEIVKRSLKERARSSPKLFRDHDELRYSIRSVLKHFHPHARGLHLLATQFPEPTTDSNQSVSSTRYGQLPQWLGQNGLSGRETWHASLDDDSIDLRIHHHAQYFSGSHGRTSFSSFAIESMLAKVPGLSEHFVYMNDDYFFTADLSPSDFYTPQYGIVLRMQPDLLVTGANPADAFDDAHGEWRALHYSNWLLDQRFGSRARPYIVHGPKAMSLSILAEISLLPTSSFAAPLLRTSRHTFRGQYTSISGHDDAYVTFLFSHYIVERWREVLLWSWVVAKIGGREGEWRDGVERMKAWKELGGTFTTEEGDDVEDLTEFLTIQVDHRDTLNEDVVNSILMREMTGPTSYAFSSLDGYPYAHLSSYGQNWPQFTSKSAWSKAHPHQPHFSPVCEIRLAQCFPNDIPNSSEAFQFVAFEQPECGDCIIQALINQSGHLGLNAILPPQNRNISLLSPSHCTEFPWMCTDEGVSAPHLPFGSDWRHNDYSMRSVLAPWAGNKTKGTPVGSVNVRQWVMQAMDRYRFVIGNTPIEFLQVTRPTSTQEDLQNIDRRKNLAMVCLNDDMYVDSADETTSVIVKWMKGRFPTPAGWEEGES